ncbi:nuclear transport factor 2 family protein [Roseateles sp.]|uniref:YybH family protein n=1 Tax=Roseateles sp. TaxID=1971397 RepID=UPI0031DB31CF
MSLLSGRRSFSRLLAAGYVAGASSVLAPGASLAAAPSLENELRQVMEASAAAWSAGKFDDFMKVYEDSPATTYISGATHVTGYGAIRAMYASRFGPGGPGSLGALRFDVLETRALGTDHALFIGRYHLKMDKPDTPEYTGLFTLVFHRDKGQWRIINDHSS